jgi:hypothetical protein
MVQRFAAQEPEDHSAFRFALQRSGTSGSSGSLPVGSDSVGMARGHARRSAGTFQARRALEALMKADRGAKHWLAKP